MTDPFFDSASANASATSNTAMTHAPASLSPWSASRLDTSHRKVVGFVIAVLLVALVGWLATRPFAQAWYRRMGPPLTAEQLKQRIAECQRENDLPCLQESWTSYLALRPNDGLALANLGMVMNRRDDHAGAVVQFQRAIDQGEGAYDLFAFYADSLARLGRTDEAIAWCYRALSVDPRLVDVRGSLAKLLVVRHRPYEALSLLESFDAGAQASGHPAWFDGQRIAIESGLGAADGARAASSAASGPEHAELRLPVFEHHFFAPIAIDGGRPAAFMIDTGATRTTIGRQLLADAKAHYRVTRPSVTMVTADGRKVDAQEILIESLRVGPFELHDASAVTCATCAPLLGQSELSHFDLRSSRTQGVEFLTLTPRAGG